MARRMVTVSVPSPLTSPPASPPTTQPTQPVVEEEEEDDDRMIETYKERADVFLANTFNDLYYGAHDYNLVALIKVENMTLTIQIKPESVSGAAGARTGTSQSV
jgi:hypothetical protein